MPLRKVLGVLVWGLSLLCLAGFLGIFCYFHFHSSDARTLDLMRGSLQLRDHSRLWVELEPGRLMFRSADILNNIQTGCRFVPLDAYLKPWNWTFDDQMGAGLVYVRPDGAGQAQLSCSFYSCGPAYSVIVFHTDPATGAPLNMPRPFNLFHN